MKTLSVSIHMQAFQMHFFGGGVVFIYDFVFLFFCFFFGFIHDKTYIWTWLLLDLKGLKATKNDQNSYSQN